MPITLFKNETLVNLKLKHSSTKMRTQKDIFPNIFQERHKDPVVFFGKSLIIF